MLEQEEIARLRSWQFCIWMGIKYPEEFKVKWKNFEDWLDKR